MAEKIEYDLLVNGKKARTSIEDVEKAQENLDKSVTKTTSSISASWVKIGAGAAVVAAALTKVTQEGYKWEKATFGMSDSMKEFAQQMSITSDLTSEQIAGFIRTGESAGIAEDQIKKMIDQAIALGRAYPHESTETFIDNLSMLYTSGEAQGYIVDILEQKYGTLDLSLLSTAEKMAVVEERIKGINELAENNAAGKLTTIFNAIGVAIDNAGSAIIKFIDNIGIFDGVIEKFKQWGLINEKIKQDMKDINKAGEDAAYSVKAMGDSQLNMWDKISSGMLKYAGLNKTVIEQAKKEQDELASVGSNAMKTLEDSLVTAAKTGKLSFTDMADSILSDLLRVMIRQQVVNSIATSMGGFFAQGGVVGGESPVQKRFATGGIVNRPTRFANGGMVGERNRAEAILPLERTANGDLGVKTAGGGSNVVVNIENQTGSNIDASDITTSSNKEQETINIVLKGISKNTSGIRDLLKGM
jgi:hypothetical protein